MRPEYDLLLTLTRKLVLSGSRVALTRKLSAHGFFNYERDRFYFDLQERSTVINSLRSKLLA